LATKTHAAVALASAVFFFVLSALCKART
jgi:hypothetical protein